MKSWVINMAYYNDDEETFLSASSPTAANPMYWEEWDNMNGSLSIKSWIWQKGFFISKDQLICFQHRYTGPQLVELNAHLICNSKKDCLAGVDENECPFYKGDTLLLTTECS